MTREEMIRNYELHTAANYYQFGFEYKGNLYSYSTANLNDVDEALKFDRTSTERGGHAKIRIRFSAKMKACLIANRKAIKLGNIHLLDYADKWNKGEHFEHYIHDINGKEYRKNHVPFYQSGDIEINGKQVQLKYDAATLVEETTLNRLLALA